MKIHKISTVIEIPEVLEEGTAKTMCDKPYYVERTEQDGEVIWWGYNTNWKKDKVTGKWSQLVNNAFFPCKTPDYENIYLKLKKDLEIKN